MYVLYFNTYALMTRAYFCLMKKLMVISLSLDLIFIKIDLYKKRNLIGF